MKFLNDNIDFSKVSNNYAKKRGFFIGGISYGKKDFEEIGYYGSVDIVFYEGELLGVNLPEKVEMLVTATEPAVKGNTTNNAQKDAVLETGHTVRVPLFIEEGETILISTKDGKYVSRA